MKNKIIWAVDPYHNRLPALVAEAELLSSYFGNHGETEIQPVFVLTPAVRLLPTRFFDELLPELVHEASARLAKLQSEIRELSMRKPKLLIHPSDHVENIATALVNYARQERAGLIALRTYGRKGLARLIQESLSETLLKNAEGQPVLVFKPDTGTDASAKSGERPVSFMRVA